MRNAQSQLTAITAQLGHQIADAGVRAAVVEELQADIAAQLAAGAEFDPAMMAEVAAERASESPSSFSEPAVAARPDRER